MVARPTVGAKAEDPERARERVAAWVADVGLGLRKVSGSGILTALRHGCPQFDPVDLTGEGADDDGDSVAGRSPDAGRLVDLPAPDAHADLEDEQEDADRWRRALAALAALRSGDVSAGGPTLPEGVRGDEAAEIVRRHHGLDGTEEDQRGGGVGGGESFQSIADAGLRCSGRRPCKEVVRRTYLRAIAALQRMLERPAALPKAEPVAVDAFAVAVDAGERAPAPGDAIARALRTFNARRAAVRVPAVRTPPHADLERDDAPSAWDEAMSGFDVATAWT